MLTGLAPAERTRRENTGPLRTQGFGLLQFSANSFNTFGGFLAAGFKYSP